MYFRYDGDTPIGLEFDGVEYYYVTNLQGDVIAILNDSGECVAEYSYDAWGRCSIIKDTNTIAYINPICYRGYYYDSDTDLYYLQSRYYDANTGRFINADDAMALSIKPINPVQSNLFSYCYNNPINNNDANGMWVASIGIEVIAACVFGISGAYAANIDGNGNCTITATVGFLIMFNVGISIGIYGAYYPWYKSVNDIKGWGFSVGVSWMAGVYLGGNGSFEIGNNVYTHAASVSVGAGASLAPIPTLYVKGSYTKKLFSFNIKKFIKSGKKKKSSLKGVSFTLTPFKTCVRLTCNKTKTRIYLQNNYKVKVLK